MIDAILMSVAIVGSFWAITVIIGFLHYVMEVSQ